MREMPDFQVSFEFLDMAVSSTRLTALQKYLQFYLQFYLYRLHCSVNLSGLNPVFLPSADTDLEART
jgi:hypothetical protein